MTPQETEPDLPVNVQESPAEAWVGSGLLQIWKGAECSMCTQDSVKEVTIILNTSSIVFSLLMGGAVYPPCYLPGAKLWGR